MSKQYKIILANILTFIFAIMTIMCLFSLKGFSLQTIIALMCSYIFGYMTTCFYKIENMLRVTNFKSNRNKNDVNVYKDKYNYVA